MRLIILIAGIYRQCFPKVLGDPSLELGAPSRITRLVDDIPRAHGVRAILTVAKQHSRPTTQRVAWSVSHLDVHLTTSSPIARFPAHDRTGSPRADSSA